MLFAFVDESCRVRQDDACLYVLAAVVLPAERLDQVRSVMDALRHGKAPTVHWRTERAPRRSLIANTVASLDCASMVAVGFYGTPSRSERARRRCLERLLPELSIQRAGAVILESRREQDARDRAILTALRRQGRISSEMSVNWQRAGSDAALWTADVVAGIVTGWLDGDQQWWPLLEQQVTLLDAGEA
ncbi:hypothetical protein [Sphaerisporangium rhizosphaerae]|uniref:DUF3800 domain-containing protein n=1 Tax=Sphaerisporangium rhizosphaerae TaxID=2269375 RepID=A0ABW2P0X6_9ACTN